MILAIIYVLNVEILKILRLIFLNLEYSIKKKETKWKCEEMLQKNSLGDVFGCSECEQPIHKDETWIEVEFHQRGLLPQRDVGGSFYHKKCAEKRFGKRLIYQEPFFIRNKIELLDGSLVDKKTYDEMMQQKLT